MIHILPVRRPLSIFFLYWRYNTAMEIKADAHDIFFLYQTIWFDMYERGCSFDGKAGL
jgi:hypothetical protein